MSFAGVSVIADGRLRQPWAVYPGTASRSGYHLLVVEGYSRTKRTPNGVPIECRPFMLGGHRWVLDIYPNGKYPESAGSISIFLVLLDEQQIARPVKVCFDFSFIDEVEVQAPACVRATEVCEFSTDASCIGHSSLITREDLEMSGHLKDDCFAIRCDIVIADPLAPFIEVPPSNMRRHFNKLLETKVGTDVTFMVDGETFVAHRCVLAARSAVFMAELFGSMEEGMTDNVIQIKDMESSIFKALLRFIYTDSWPKMEEVPSSMEVEGDVQEITWLQQLLVAADRYDLQRLKSMCEEQLAGHIGLCSVTTILTLAQQQHCSELKEACLEFLNVQSATALQGVMSTRDWEHMSTTYPCVLNKLIAKLASRV
jgi:speckle-type POZ protein